MTSFRVALASSVVACIVVLAVLAWADARTPVTISIDALPSSPVHVSMAGAVATPGIVVVGPESRLADAVAAAGGLRDDADVSGLNLAGRVGDGEHIVIPVVAGVNTTPTGTEARIDSGPIDINVATAAELETLPGIGEVLAARIVTYRETHGPFATIDDLTQVEGISTGLLDDLRPLVRVTNGG
jgi:competence protein ComEA